MSFRGQAASASGRGLARTLDTMKPSIQAASYNPGISALLRGSKLPISDLETGVAVSFFVAGSAHSPTGVIGLEVYGPAALLRSLAVSESERGRGLGAALLQHAEQHAASAGISSIYLLTSTAEPFFAARGYQRSNRKEAPSSIAATREFSSICPASAAFMVKVCRA